MSLKITKQEALFQPVNLSVSDDLLPDVDVDSDGAERQARVEVGEDYRNDKTGEHFEKCKWS